MQSIVNYNLKQDIELMVYYFSNGTLNVRESEAIGFDYRDKVIDNPELYSMFGDMLMDCLKNRGKIMTLKLEVLNLIHNYEPKKYFREDDRTKNDVYTVSKRFFDFIAEEISQNSDWFEKLMKWANDIQLVFCVWGNNITVDENGNVTNELYAQNRAKEFIESIFKKKEPENPFEDWEMVHNT